MGKAGIFNTRMNPEAIKQCDALQRSVMLPLLRSQLNGTERVILDFGCGWGRWTQRLADIIGGLAIGVDPTPHFLELAEPEESVEFRLYEDGHIPCEDASVDVIWCSLVLSVIIDDDLFKHTVIELGRVLKPCGLMFLSDNTAGPPCSRTGRVEIRGHWSRSRTVQEYIDAFAGWVELKFLGNYENLQEVDSIMAGRKSGIRS